MRALIVYPTMVLMTLVLGTPIIILSLFGVRIPPDSFFGRAPHLWAKTVLWVAGVKVVVRNPQYIAPPDQPRVYVSNHVSWFEIFALASVIPHYRFVAKKELASLPVFGRAAREVAGIFIDRQNRKAAFEAYAAAAEQIRGGINVAVYPEGTRGRSYELRPFKKGPFVLAIAAQVPIVPVVSWGTREVQGKGEIAIRAGVCELTFLEPVPTAGMTYDDRDRLVGTVWHRMAAVLEEKGVHSSGSPTETTAV
ncbi:MAG TPA: lysophospholipid acyltransferase family protein [Gemmatimonadaceae bacterium]|nr:lysophospholipid acyltransferase family protein [Gemmatimonadaceae bacterium]